MIAWPFGIHELQRQPPYTTLSSIHPDRLRVKRRYAPRRYLKAAIDAAARIRSHEVATEAGKTWPIATGGKRNMPNFSHGTAGVAYFLATLYEQTREKEFLDAAVLGGRYLTSVADAATRRG